MISKLPFPVATVGLTGTLAAEGAENSWRVFSAMEFEVDGAKLTGSTTESET